MKRSFVIAAAAASLLLVLTPSTVAARPDARVLGSVVISAVNQPTEGSIKVCMYDCEMLPDRDQEATLRLAFDPAAETGRIVYRDKGVLYDGRPFAIRGTVEATIVSELHEIGYVQYLLEGSYRAHPGAAVPAGSFRVYVDTYTDSVYLTVYLFDFSVPFSYVNQGPALKYRLN